MMLYFGCWPTTWGGMLGHYMWLPNRTQAYNSFLEDMGLPIQLYPNHIDGALCPKGPVEGACRIVDIQGWSVLALQDRSGDSRPGSNSAFILRDPMTAPYGPDRFSELLNSATEEFPDVMRRIRAHYVRGLTWSE